MITRLLRRLLGSDLPCPDWCDLALEHRHVN
jgi:hypothetical protein